MIGCLAYNLSGGLDLRGLADVIEAASPDIVCATEVPSRLALRRLGGRVGLDVAVRAGRRRLSVAIFVGESVRVISTDSHELSSAPDLPQRCVAQAILGVGSLRLAVFAVQLGMRPELREEHTQELEAVVARVDVPVVIGADLNEPPGGASATRLSHVLIDAWATAGEGIGHTFPNPEPMTRTDYLFVDRRLAVARAYVPDDDRAAVASHHRPVVAWIADVVEADLPRASEEPAA